MARPPSQLDAEGLYQKAVRALARRSRTEAELRRLLRPRAQAPDAVETALVRLRDHGYLDDARLAAGFVLYEKDVNHHGRGRALRDLRARGIAGEVAAAAVAQGYVHSHEDTLLRAFLRKKRLRRPADLRQTGNLYRKLLLAGFSPAACQRALRAWKLDPEWTEMLETMQEETE